jgi:hypothetical protein
MISNVFALERDICINRKKNRFYIRINKTREKANMRMVLRQLAWLHMEYMSMRYDIPNLVVHIRISLIEGC